MGGIGWSRARVRRMASLAGLLVAGIGCTDGPAEPSASAPDRVLFVRNHALMVVNIDGSNERTFSSAATSFSHPQLAPDGESIIVTASPPSWCSQIMEIALDGSIRRTLPIGDWCVGYPRLSLNGQRIAFKAAAPVVDPPPAHIAVMNRDGTGLINLSAMLPQPTAGCTASGTPKITYHLMGWLSDTRVQIYRHVCGLGSAYFGINVDGSNVTQDYAGMISPDGSRTVRGGPAVIVTNLASGTQSVIGQGAVQDRTGIGDQTFYSPWTADGSHVLFFKTGAGFAIAKADGSGETPVPRMPPLSTPWGFAGRHDRLLYTEWFAAGEQSVWNLYALTNDGSDPVPLSVGKGSVSHVVFLPGR